MFKKLAKIKYLPNNFQIIENGDHVDCAFQEKKLLENLTYWNVELKKLIILTLKLKKREKK